MSDLIKRARQKEADFRLAGWDFMADFIKELADALENPAQAWLTVAAAEELARKFHETYERLALEFGYVTREDTRQFDPESANGKLMIAVCRELASEYPPAVCVPVDKLEHWLEYWNGSNNEKAMSDALDFILGEISDLITAARKP